MAIRSAVSDGAATLLAEEFFTPETGVVARTILMGTPPAGDPLRLGSAEVGGSVALPGADTSGPVGSRESAAAASTGALSSREDPSRFMTDQVS